MTLAERVSGPQGNNPSWLSQEHPVRLSVFENGRNDASHFKNSRPRSTRTFLRRKSCLFAARPSELAALLKVVPLYVMIVDASSEISAASAMTSPRVHSTASLLLDAYPFSCAFRCEKLSLFSQLGEKCGDIEVSVRLTDNGPALLRHFRHSAALPSVLSDEGTSATAVQRESHPTPMELRNAELAIRSESEAGRVSPFLNSASGPTPREAGAEPTAEALDEAEGEERGEAVPTVAVQVITSEPNSCVENKAKAEVCEDDGRAQGTTASTSGDVMGTQLAVQSNALIANAENEEKDGACVDNGANAQSTFIDLVQRGVEGLVNGDRKGEEVDEPSEATASGANVTPAKEGRGVLRELLMELGDLVEIKQLLSGVSITDLNTARLESRKLVSSAAETRQKRHKGIPKQHVEGYQRETLYRRKPSPFLAGAVRTVPVPPPPVSPVRPKVQTKEGLRQLCRPTAASKAATVNADEVAARARQQHKELRQARIAAEKRALAAERTARALSASALLQPRGPDAPAVFKQTTHGLMMNDRLKKKSRPDILAVGARRQGKVGSELIEQNRLRHTKTTKKTQTNAPSSRKISRPLVSTISVQPADPTFDSVTKISMESIQVPTLPAKTIAADLERVGVSLPANSTREEGRSYETSMDTTETKGQDSDVDEHNITDEEQNRVSLTHTLVSSTVNCETALSTFPTLTPTEELARRTLSFDPSESSDREENNEVVAVDAKNIMSSRQVILGASIMEGVPSVEPPGESLICLSADNLMSGASSDDREKAQQNSELEDTAPAFPTSSALDLNTELKTKRSETVSPSLAPKESTAVGIHDIQDQEEELNAPSPPSSRAARLQPPFMSPSQFGEWSEPSTRTQNEECGDDSEKYWMDNDENSSGQQETQEQFENAETFPLEKDVKSPSKRQDWRELLSRKLGRKIEYPKPLKVNDEDEHTHSTPFVEHTTPRSHNTSADISAELTFSPQVDVDSVTTPVSTLQDGSAAIENTSFRQVLDGDKREFSPRDYDTPLGGSNAAAHARISQTGSLAYSENFTEYSEDFDDASVTFESGDSLPLGR